ncbi:hypothetical protein CNR22_13265 [Sphingobacteriaceae bacterium]|nr:hypothetical protein CNR22_13265 [Sphingobacteriaceae bacterium]
MKNKANIFLVFIALLPFLSQAQNNTFSPYSRYGLGELSQPTFAHNTGMGGAHIALKPDSTMPIFINVGNPASYALIRLTTLEVGGSFLHSTFKGNNNTSLTKWGTSFAYGALGFPVRKNGGAAFGLMPFSSVGYETNTTINQENIGAVQYKYYGNGGLNKAFIGYGILPFKNKLANFRSKYSYLPDSMRTLTRAQYVRRQLVNKLVSDLSLGFNVNYIFGNVSNSTRIVYPNSLTYNNTYRDRVLTVGDFTGNFGAQTGVTIDSTLDHKGRKARIAAELKVLSDQNMYSKAKLKFMEDSIASVTRFDTTLDKKGKKAKIASEIKILSDQNIYSEAQLKMKRDSLAAVTPLYRRAYKQKPKFTFGYFMNLNNGLKSDYVTGVYNYVLNGSGQEILRDTVLYPVSKAGTIRLPLEQGFGIGFKKGERLNMVADFAITDWTTFKYLNDQNDFKKSYRVSVGANFVPEKYAAGRGSFGRKVNYRIGASYQTGYLSIEDNLISDYSVSLGIGLPVGINRISSMVNVSAQYGFMGSSDPSILKQNYWRVNFGFTFCDRWFQKYRED